MTLQNDDDAGDDWVLGESELSRWADVDAEIPDDEEEDELDEDAVEDEDEGEGADTVEEIAARAGWKPKSQWRGEGWVPADEFLERSAKRAQTASRKEREAEERIERLERAHQVSITRMEAQMRAQAEAMKRKIIAEGGEDAYERTQIVEEVLAEEAAKLRAASPTEASAPQLTALDRQFFTGHAWLTDDATFEDGADAEEADEAFELAARTMKSVIDKTGDVVAAHEAADKALRRAFPQRYQQDQRPARRMPALAEGGASRRGGGGGAASRLPPEARRAGESFVKRGTFASLEEYANVYFEEEKKGRR